MKEFIDKLISRLEEMKNTGSVTKTEMLITKACVNKAIEIVNELAGEYKGGWIPCSENQPPKPRFNEDTYLIQQSEVVTPFSAYWNGECWTDVLYDEIENVIAWMPLPAPYTEGE